jgi:hypothetical protein
MKSTMRQMEWFGHLVDVCVLILILLMCSAPTAFADK